MTTTERRKLPDFLVIGAGKSGTTSLDNYLSEHPGVFISPVKEPNFFAYYKHKAEDFEIPESRQHYIDSVTTFEDYYNLFSGATDGQVKGETSNTYMYGKYSIETIKEFIPDVKLIAILRQPAERLYSRYLHLAREGLLPTPDFNDCLNRSTIWWQRPDLINEGFYYKHLKKIYDQFPKENIKIFLFEDLKQRPEELLRELFTFLNVDPDFKPDTEVVYNQSGFIKNKFLNQLIGPNGWLMKLLKGMLPFVVRWAKSNNYLEKKVDSMRASNLRKPKMSIETRQALIDVYKDDLKELEKLIDRDLSHWYK